MMVMQPTPAVAFHRTSASHQPRQTSRKQPIDSGIPNDVAAVAVAFPSSTSAESIPLQSISNTVINRPREARPLKQDAVVDNHSNPNIPLKSEQNSPTPQDETPSDQESSQDTHDSTDFSHRRDRSHFSIPDVIVTSSVEEGGQKHYEMRVEPTRRKVDFPFRQTDLTSGLKLMETTRIQLTPAQRAALENEENLVKAISEVKIFKPIKGKPKMPAPLAMVGRMSSEGDVRRDRSVVGSVESAPENKAVKRPRRSSLSGLFSRKDREAAIAASNLPPSPTLHWQKPPSPPPTQSSTAYSSLSSFFSTSASSRSASYSSNATSNSPSPTMSASPVQSPTISQSSSTSPSPPAGTFKSIGKKETKAKSKEEQLLIKELEKVDKMVRKHDKEAQKAAARKTSVSSNEATCSNTSELKAKKSLIKMSVFRQSTPSANKSSTRSASALPSYVKASARAVLEAGKQKPYEAILHAPTNDPILDRRDSNDDSPNISWNGDAWTDLASPVEEQLVSLTTCSPIRSPAEKDFIVSLPAVKRTPSLQRKSSGSQHSVNSKMGSRRGSLRRGSNDAKGKTKRQSFMRSSFGLTLNLAGASDMEWEDSYDFSAKAANEGVMPIKRCSLLESLYKDIEEMETTFQLEHRDISRRSQSHAQKNDPRRPSIAHSVEPHVTSKENSASAKQPNTKHRAGTLPPQVKEQEEEASLNKSTSAPNFF
jgi:hypothetical protein